MWVFLEMSLLSVLFGGIRNIGTVQGLGPRLGPRAALGRFHGSGGRIFEAGMHVHSIPIQALLLKHFRAIIGSFRAIKAGL